MCIKQGVQTGGRFPSCSLMVMGVRLLPPRHVPAAAAVVILTALAASAAGGVEDSMGSKYLYDDGGAVVGATTEAAVVEDEVPPEFPVALVGVGGGREDDKVRRSLDKDKLYCKPDECVGGSSYISHGHGCIYENHCQSGPPQ
uniref:Uncharacterized protein n=1 Tax=Oryza brachyantha TaxID=4533 RepID=J3NEC2_ORYBR